MYFEKFDLNTSNVNVNRAKGATGATGTKGFKYI